MKPGDLVRRIPRYGNTLIYKDRETKFFRGYLEDGDVVCVLERFHPAYYTEGVNLLKIITHRGIGWIHDHQVEVINNETG